MTDARLPERWLHDRRIQHLPCPEYKAFFNALMWSVSNRTDGVITPDDLSLIPACSADMLDDLVTAGVCGAFDGGWFIGDFAETQTSSAELAALSKARIAQRQRQARYRAKLAGQRGGDVTGDVTGDAVTSTVTTQDRTGQDSLRSSRPTQGDIPAEVVNPPSQKPELRKSGTSPGGPEKRATRLPEGWYPPRDVADTMKQRFPHVDLRTEHELFCNYWHAKSGQQATKRDWVATWRNWIIKAAQQTPTHNGHAVKGRADVKGMGFQGMKESPATGRSEERLELE
jgi:hypothetical protein